MPDSYFEVVDALNATLDAKGDPDPTRPENDPSRPTLISELRPYWERYTDEACQAQMEPMRVVVETDGIMAGYDNPTFDGILARMVTDEALNGDTLDGRHSPYLLPVPLYQLWTDPQTGLPLWACNHYRPAGPSEEVAYYWHKRAIRPEHAKKQTGQKTPYTRKGRYKEKRRPVPAQTAKTWWADCIGVPDEVNRLLTQGLDAMGKKRKALVRSVCVEGISRFEMNRPVPLRYFDDPADVEKHSYMGWTPPYWPGVPQVQAECGMPSS